MKNYLGLVMITLILISLILISFPTQILADYSAAGQTFLRASLAPGMLVPKINADAVLQLAIDGNKTSVPLKLIQDQPIFGEVQLPFTQGSYSVRIATSEGSSSIDILRVSGTLVQKSPGVFEHTATEAIADSKALSFSTDGAALIIAAGSVNGSVVLLMQSVSDESLQVSLSLDSDGDGAITDKDVHEIQIVTGPQISISTESLDGLPLTSKIQVNIKNADGTQLGKIEGPYDLANLKASAQPLQELDQKHIKAALVYVKRIPMLTEIQIPSSKLVPPTETVQVQPQSAAQDVLAAFGDTASLKQLFQVIDFSDSTVLQPSHTELPSSDAKSTNDDGFMEKLTAVFAWLKSSGGTIMIGLGVILIAGLVALVLWYSNRPRRSSD